MSGALLVAALLAQTLPPNHPPIGDTPVRAKTPLPVPSAAQDAGIAQLPPGHPPLDSAGTVPAAPSGGANLPAGHPPIGGGKAPDLDQLMRQLDENKELRKKDKSFEVANAIGRLYYTNARYADAIEFLRQAMAKAEPARAFFLEQRKKAGKKALPPPESVGCELKPDRPLDQALGLAKDKARSDASAGASCARAALQPVLDAEGMLANAAFIQRDAQSALTSYDRILEVAENSAEARYGRAAVIVDARGDDLKLLAKAKQDLVRLAADSPSSPRAKQGKELLALVEAAQGAGGMSKLAAQRTAEAKVKAKNLPPEPPAAPMAMGGPSAGGGAPAQSPQGNGLAAPLNQDVVDAVQNTERTPELMAHLTKLVDEAEDHLAHQRYQDALNNYRGVVPFEPENARARAGMAWALVGLNKQPMADRMWGMAASSDPAALDQLGDALKAKGDGAGARQLWTKLAQSSPDYAGKARLAEKAK